MGRERKITLALIGRGNWGQNYINTIKGLSECQLPQAYIKTRDYPELFEKEDLDGVIVATPISTHYKIAKEFLERGFNLLIEKPVTKTLKQALALSELSRIHNEVVVMVGHIQVYDPAYVEMKKHLDKIGKVRQLVYKGLQSTPRVDTTVLEDWGPHPIYLFLNLVGKPISVDLEKTAADNLRLNFKFRDGVVGTADIGWTSKERKRELTIVGARGSLTLDGSSSDKQLYFIDINGNKTNIDFPSEKSPLAEEILEFLNCIRTGKNLKTPLSQGIEVLKIMDNLLLK